VDHATKIASIISLGSSLNPHLLNPSEDCRVYDLDLFPDPAFRDSYYGSLGDYLAEIRSSVQRAKDATGARVYNLSYNLQRAPGGMPYSVVASGLDRIALDLDVLFVVSSGNLSSGEERPEWPAASADAVAMLAADPNDDGLAAPAESIANVSVSAINPTGMPRHVEGAPAAYTRRGVQVPSSLKPDFAAPGGATPSSGDRQTGLLALAASTGRCTPVKGTSYAAPIVARFLDRRRCLSRAANRSRRSPCHDPRGHAGTGTHRHRAVIRGSRSLAFGGRDVGWRSAQGHDSSE